LQEFRLVFGNYSQLKKELESLQLQQANANKEFDYNKFLFDELEEAGLKENELEELDAELKLLSNAEQVKQQLNSIYFELIGSDQPIVQQLKILHNKLLSLGQYHTAITGLAERLQSVQLELKDIAGELETIDDSIQYSPERIQAVNDKIAL